MKLSKEQIRALAIEFVRPVNAIHSAEVKRREKEQRARWDKTPDGRLRAKMPAWMKEEIGDYQICRREEYKALANKSPLPPKLEVCDVEHQIIVATIDAQNTSDITAALKKHFRV